MRWSALVAAMLLVPVGLGLAAGDGEPPAGAWTQLRGGPGHNGVVEVGAGALDVVRVLDLLPAGVAGSSIEYDTSGIVWTPYGLVGLTNEPIPAGPATVAAGGGALCGLVRLADPLAGTPEHYGPGIICSDGAHLVGYDAVSDDLLVCFDGQAPLAGIDNPISGPAGLQGWHARTGEVRWSVPPSVEAPVQGANNNNDWFCGAVAVDEASRTAYVPWGNDQGQNRIEAIGLDDHATRWSVPVRMTEFSGVFNPGDPCSAIGCVLADPLAKFVPVWITMTTTGIVATGQIIGTLGTQAPDSPDQGFQPLRNMPAAVWLDTDGGIVGSALPDLTTVEATPLLAGEFLHSGSDGFAANGAQAAGILGQAVVFIDPAAAAYQVVPIDQTPQRYDVQAPPAWAGASLLLPNGDGAYIVETASPDGPRFWPGFGGGYVGAVAATPDGDGFAIVQRTGPAGRLTDLLRIDLASGVTAHHLALPIDDATVRITPLAEIGGLLAWGIGGQAVVLAPVPVHERPKIVVSTEYPAIGEEVLLSGLAGVHVAWGDGALEVPKTSTVTHSYDTERRHVLRVTEVHPDGLTATTELTMHVGEAEPQSLNWVQQRFEPENQETTYFLLGLIVTLIGAVVAIVARRRRGRTLAGEVAHLDAIRAQGRSDALAAAVRLAEYRRGLAAKLNAGGFSEAQYAHLDTASRDLLRPLRRRVMDALGDRAGVGLARRFEDAFDDAHLDEAEAADLRRSIRAANRLRAAERRGLEDLVAAWSVGPRS